MLGFVEVYRTKADPSSRSYVYSLDFQRDFMIFFALYLNSVPSTWRTPVIWMYILGFVGVYRTKADPSSNSYGPALVPGHSAVLFLDF